MRHERDCSCEHCRPAASLSDNILMITLGVAGAAFAIMSGSTRIVAAGVALLIAVIAFKIAAPMLGSRQRRPK